MKDFSKIEKKAKSFFKSANGSHEWEHTLRVKSLALHIARKENANLEIVELSALLHDIARHEEMLSHGKINHALRGAELAGKILSKEGFEKETIQQVIECIKSHRSSRGPNPKSLEAKCLFDADKLDGLGAVGIGRLFFFASHYNARLHNSEISLKGLKKIKEYSKEDTPFREFMLKVRFAKDKLFTKEGKRIAKERHDFMQEFFDRLTKEVKGRL